MSQSASFSAKSSVHTRPQVYANNSQSLSLNSPELIHGFTIDLTLSQLLDQDVKTFSDLQTGPLVPVSTALFRNNTGLVHPFTHIHSCIGGQMSPCDCKLWPFAQSFTHSLHRSIGNNMRSSVFHKQIASVVKGKTVKDESSLPELQRPEG